MLSKIYLFLALALYTASNVYCQADGTLKESRNRYNETMSLTVTDTFSNLYNETHCGLNYVHKSIRLGQRFSPQGIPQPASCTIAGIPSCAIIEKAYLWTEILGYGSIPVTAILGDTSGNSMLFPMTHVGTSQDVCWTMGHTQVYRADVTSFVTGNGTYVLSGFPVSVNSTSYDVEGVTILVIYRDPSAQYTGMLVLDDGAITKRGGQLNYTMRNVSLCGAPDYAEGIWIIGDKQDEDYIFEINGNPMEEPYADWWNAFSDTIAASVTDSVFNFHIYDSTDCYTLVVAGLYTRANCNVCVNSSPVIINASIVHANCGFNGSIMASVTGGIPPYTYSWSNNSSLNQPANSNLGPGTYVLNVLDSGGNCAGMTIVIQSQSPVISQLLITNEVCNNDGSATVTVSGGTPPYQYVWDNGSPSSMASINTLGQGIHTLYIQDSTGGCINTTTFSVGQSGVLQVMPTVTPSYCNAPTGTASVTVSGGIPPYTYLWNTIPAQFSSVATGLVANTSYQVTVTDSAGCDRVVTVAVPAINFQITAAVGGMDTICSPNPNLHNGWAWVSSITNGIGPFSYSWNSTPPQYNDTAIGLGTGVCNVTVIDSGSGCASNTSVYISTRQPFTINTASTAPTCLQNNGTITVTSITGGTNPPYTYSWNTSPPQYTNVATGLGPGGYIVTVTDARGCSRSKTVALTATQSFSLSFSNNAIIRCDSLILDTGEISVLNVSGSGTPPYTHTWNTSPPQTGDTAYFITPGTYQVLTTDANGCMANTTVNAYSFYSFTPQFTTTPENCPVLGSSTLTSPIGNGYSHCWNTNPPTLSPTIYQPAGQYTITVSDTNGCSITRTVVIPQASSAFSVSASSWSANCDTIAGSVFALVQNGVPPYSYSWNTTPVQTIPGLWGLAPGQYIVTVTDSLGCIETDTTTLAGAGYLSGNFNLIGPTCSLQAGASIIPVGGVPPYSYLWNTNPTQTGDTVMPLLPGIYDCLITDSVGCATTVVVNVPPSNFVIYTSPLVMSGCGDSLLLTASSSEPNTSFLWTPGNLTGDSIYVVSYANSTYTLTSTTPCGVEYDTVTVNINANTLNAVICNVTVDSTLNKNKVAWQLSMGASGGKINVYKEVGLNTYTLAGFSFLNQGNSWVDMSSSPGSGSSKYKIAYEDSCGQESNLSLPHQTIFLTVTSSTNNGWILNWNSYSGFVPVNYAVYKRIGTGPFSLLGLTSPQTNTYSDPGPVLNTVSYLVVALVNYNCLSTDTVNINSMSNIVTINNTGLDETAGFSGVVGVFPNPANETIHIESQNNCSIKLINALGEVILVSADSKQNHILDSSGISAGFYIVEVNTADNQTVKLRICIMH